MPLPLDPQEFFQPNFHYALVGASNNRTDIGFGLYMLLCDEKYNVSPVQPDEKTVQGDMSYPSLSKLVKLKGFPDVIICAMTIEKEPHAGIAICKGARDLGLFRIWCEPKCDTLEMRTFARENNITLMTNLSFEKEMITFLTRKDKSA